VSARFHDRSVAGQMLAKCLMHYAKRSDVVVLGLPRGGVPVAYEIARALQVPLDICLVRKLGVPSHHELAMGAIATGGVKILNPDVIAELGISPQDIAAVTAKEQRELERRTLAYRGHRLGLELQGRTIILVDDGLATGATIRAAIAALRQQHPKAIIVAVPVAAKELCEELNNEVDQVVCLITPHPLQAIGLWYEDFSQTTDAEVRELLQSEPNET
jgi:putative phosphoribosyl transferase